MSIGSELRKRLDNISNRTRVGWDFRKKIKLLSNPEAHCPYCDNWFPTRRNWLINDDSNHIIGCWNLDGSQINSDHIIHPHAWMSGEVCLGSFLSASEALFAGIAEGKHVHYVPRWLDQLGHKCDQMPFLLCGVCGRKFLHHKDDDPQYVFGYRAQVVCSLHCLDMAKAFRCEECMRFIDLEQRKFCDDCENLLYITCSVCSAKMMERDAYFYSRHDLRCCQRCFAKRLLQCRDCDYHEVTLNDDDLCDFCAANPIIRCNGCDVIVGGPDDLMDGKCEECDNYCGDCECSPCECEPEF